MNTPLKEWSGEFGNDYAIRQPDMIEARAALFDDQIGIGELAPTMGTMKILEVGANLGQNLEALHRIGFELDELHGLEPNGPAAVALNKKGFRLVSGTAQDIEAPDGHYNLVFTNGVLIHIPPHEVIKAAREIVRVSNRYVLAIEYYSAKPEMIEYQGQKDMLWKRDFGEVYLELGLKPIDCGFAWRPLTGLDNVTWWLFSK